MQTITCPHCKKQIEVSQVLHDEVFEQIKKAEEEKFKQELVEAEQKAKKKVQEELNLQIKSSKEEAQEAQEKSRTLQEQLLELTKVLREQKEKTEQMELENEKKLLEEREKQREEITKKIEEKAQLEVAELKKKLEDTQKSLAEAQQKSQQTSQQLQGEVLELELEEFLINSFPHDEISPIGKGVHGADIRHVVKSPRGTICGIILWESKRTKHWEDKWIDKLKEDVRFEKANVPVIVSSEMPKEIKTGIGLFNGVWVIKQEFVLPLAELLRKNLLDVGYQKAIMANKTEKADMLYTYVTSHEFQQQVELIVDVYKDMQEQILKERVAFEKSWKQREAQVHKLLIGTASIVGSMQGRVGASMPQIKGLELLEEETIEEQKLL